MKELTTEEVRGLGHAVGLEIRDPELTEVTYSLNALLEDLDHIDPPGWIRSNRCPSSCHRARPPVWSRGVTGSPRSRHQDLPSEGPDQFREKRHDGTNRNPFSVGIPAV